jgi:hypothetical protein
VCAGTSRIEDRCCDRADLSSSTRTTEIIDDSVANSANDDAGRAPPPARGFYRLGPYVYTTTSNPDRTNNRAIAVPILSRPTTPKISSRVSCSGILCPFSDTSRIDNAPSFTRLKALSRRPSLSLVKQVLYIVIWRFRRPNSEPKGSKRMPPTSTRTVRMKHAYK